MQIKDFLYFGSSMNKGRRQENARYFLGNDFCWIWLDLCWSQTPWEPPRCNLKLFPLPGGQEETEERHRPLQNGKWRVK